MLSSLMVYFIKTAAYSLERTFYPSEYLTFILKFIKNYIA